MRQTLRSVLCLALLLSNFTFSSIASASVVREASLAELAHVSEIIVHAVVQRVDDARATGPEGPFETAIELEILEPVKGLSASQKTFTLILPGGRAGTRTMRIPGMPQFRDGEEVVLLLENVGPQRWALSGLSQGVFRVTRTAGRILVRRELGDVFVVRKAKTAALAAPTTLDDLLIQLRALSRGDTTKSGGVP